MRVVLRSLFPVVMVFAAIALLEARFDAFDSLTMHEPAPMRKLVAALALRETGTSDLGLDRVIAFDPANVRAWERRCSSLVGLTPAEWMSDCRRAIVLAPTAPNFRALGSAEEAANQACDAESSYREALRRPELPEGQRPILLRDEARAAIGCGHPGASLDALKDAERIDLADGPERNIAAHDGLAADRGYMSVAYEQMEQAGTASHMCSQANPTYASCSCKITGTALICTQTPQMIASR